MGIEDNVALMRYGDPWRLARRMFHQEFNSRTTMNIKDLQYKYTL